MPCLWISKVIDCSRRGMFTTHNEKFQNCETLGTYSPHGFALLPQNATVTTQQINITVLSQRCLGACMMHLHFKRRGLHDDFSPLRYSQFDLCSG